MESVEPTGPRQAMGFACQPGPDGTWWVVITHQAGAMSFTWGIPLDGADTTADDIANAIKETAKQGRRDRSGLVIANATGVNPNGSRAVRRRR